jgi:VWFA-related protein
MVASLSALAVAQGTPQTPQPPVFRGGTELVQVDAIVTDGSSKPVTDLSAADFELFDDGALVPISAFRFVAPAPADWHDDVVSPIRSVDDERREAEREGVRLFAMFLDEYHVQSHDAMRVVAALSEFVNHLPPSDLLAVYGPWDSVLDVRYTHDREAALRRVRAFEGRQGPHVMGRYPLDEGLRMQISTSAVDGIITHLGGLSDGRKSLVIVSERLTAIEALGATGLERIGADADFMSGVIRAANRYNVALYPLDPIGLTEFSTPQTDIFRVLASETGGIAMVNRNDYAGVLGQVTRDASAYYLLGYAPTHPNDGKFHKISVRVKRRGLSVRARSGYLATKIAATTAVAPPPREVASALDTLADATRPDRAETPAASAAPTTIDTKGPIAAPTLAVMQGRVAGEPVGRREFTRNERLLVRAAVIGQAEPQVSARLLSRQGQRLADLSVAVTGSRCELTLPLGSLAPGEYVIELNGNAGEATIQHHIAFRVIAR